MDDDEYREAIVRLALEHVGIPEKLQHMNQQRVTKVTLPHSPFECSTCGYLYARLDPNWLGTDDATPIPDRRWVGGMRA